MFSICFHIRNNQTEGEDNNENGGLNFGTNFGINFGTNTTEQKIMELMMKNPQIKTQEIAEILGFTKRNVEYAIRSLKKAGYIERIGANKNSHWVVNAGKPSGLDNEHGIPNKRGE
jgi:predicted HTH transcriptional regulator